MHKKNAPRPCRSVIVEVHMETLSDTQVNTVYPPIFKLFFTIVFDRDSLIWVSKVIGW